MKSEYIQLIIAGSSLLGILVGYFIKYILDKNKEAVSENNKIKREIYKKFTSMIFDLFNGEVDQKTKNANLKNKMYEFYKDYVIYASPKVINSFSDYMQYLYKNSDNIDVKKSMHELAKIMSAMRKDLSLSNSGLGKHGINIFRAFFTDFETIKKAK